MWSVYERNSIMRFDPHFGDNVYRTQAISNMWPYLISSTNQSSAGHFSNIQWQYWDWSGFVFHISKILRDIFNEVKCNCILFCFDFFHVQSEILLHVRTTTFRINSKASKKKAFFVGFQWRRFNIVFPSLHSTDNFRFRWINIEKSIVNMSNWNKNHLYSISFESLFLKLEFYPHSLWQCS